MLVTNGTIMKSKAAKRSANVVKKVTTLTVITNVSNFQKTVKRPIKMENALNAAKVTFSRVESVLLMIIAKNTDGLMLETNGTIMKLKTVKRSANAVKKVTTLIAITNVPNSQKTAKKLINMENVLTVVKDTNLMTESALLMIIVKNTDGLMLVRNGKRLTSKDVLKSVNVVRRVTISTVITNVNHYHAIVKKLTLTEAANAVKKVTNFAMENAFKRRKTEDIEIDKQSQIPSVAMKRIIAS